MLNIWLLLAVVVVVELVHLEVEEVEVALVDSAQP